eukprot:c20208_g3_i1 orf=2-1663(-)
MFSRLEMECPRNSNSSRCRKAYVESRRSVTAAPVLCGLIILQLFYVVATALGTTRNYNFNVQTKNVTKLCKTRTIVTINGQYPGPVIYAEEGDHIVVKVTNLVTSNLTIHWHGVRQYFSCWSDGPAYITQCPIQSGQTFTYNFTLFQQKGTLFWHAHVRWLRATVHGAIIIYPQLGNAYPFPFPYEEHTIILGEFWLKNEEDIRSDILQNGGGPPPPDCYVINGHAGPLYPCSAQDIYRIKVIPGKTYLLRLINAALNDEHFFSIANHLLTVVEADGEYTEPYVTTTLVMAPGQTNNVLVLATKTAGKYYMGMQAYSSSINVPFLKLPALGVLEYEGNLPTPPVMPVFPASNDTDFVTSFTTNTRSLAHANMTGNVATKIDRHLFITIGLNAQKCSPGQSCQGPNGGRFGASMNNISFQLPAISILQAYFENISGVYAADFPDNPPSTLNFVDPPNDPPFNTQSMVGTRVSVLEYNSNVQIILQDTGIVGTENHPIHLHGFSFYVVGIGFGNYNPTTAASFNLKNPPLRNTIAVPAGGWAAIRFKADNPGVWFM